MAEQISLDVVVASNAVGVRRSLREIEKQLPYAASVALTRQAQEARDVERDRVRQRFTIRRAHVPRGITIIRAEKRDWPNISAHVGSKDEFMADQETGATRRPKKSAFAIPTRLSRPTRRASVRKGKRPRAVLARPSGYIEGSSIKVRAKGRRGPARRLTVAYLLRRSIKITPVWGFRASVEATVRGGYAAHFDRELDKAIASGRRKAERSARAARSSSRVTIGRGFSL